MRWIGLLSIGFSLLLSSYQWGKGHAQAMCAKQKALEAQQCIVHWQQQAQATAEIETEYLSCQRNLQTQLEQHLVCLQAVSDDQKSPVLTVPFEFIRMWNLHNQGVHIPESIGEFDATPVSLKLTALIGQHAREAALCHRNTAQLEALQQWVREVSTPMKSNR